MGVLSITTKSGVIKILTTAGTYESLAKACGFFGKVAAGYEIYSTVKDYNSGEISGGTATWRIAGTTASFFTPIIYGAIVGTETAGPVGTILGIAVAVSTVVLEKAYEVAEPTIKGTIWQIGHLDLTRLGKWN